MRLAGGTNIKTVTRNVFVGCGSVLLHGGGIQHAVRNASQDRDTLAN